MSEKINKAIKDHCVNFGKWLLEKLELESKKSVISVYTKWINLCENESCETQPTYNTRGEKKARFCSSHKEPGMVDVVNPTCEFEGCETRPTYNTRGEKKGRFCNSHKHPGMVNVISPSCEFEGCETQPTYNTRGEKKARFCNSHKEPGMVDVKNPSCEFEGCETLPIYNTHGEKKAMFCNSHKEEGMVDVVNPTCEFEGCDTRPWYGTPGLRTTHCAKHKNLLPRALAYSTKKCSIPKCKELAIYGRVGQKSAISCETHKTEDLINIVEIPCLSCGLMGVVDKSSLCIDTCSPNRKSIIHGAKEREIFFALKQRLPMFSKTFISHDKVPEELSSCEQRRPDFVFRTKSSPLTVILEVDENQHDKSSSYTCSKNCTCPHRTCKCKSPATCINKDYTCGCETRRMRVISQFMHPVLWIRYNPDEYTIKGKPKGTIQPPNDKRKVILLEWLSNILGNSEKYCESVMKSGGAEVMYLFYNDFKKMRVLVQVR